jgi:glutaredoxin
MAEPLRCKTHGSVLTGAGECLLCERRAAEKSGRLLLRVLAGVLGALFLGLLGYRAYTTIADRRAESRRIEAVREETERAEAAQAALDRAEAARTAADRAATERAEKRNAAITQAANQRGARGASGAIATPPAAGPVTGAENAPSPGETGENRDRERRVLAAQRSVNIELFGADWCPSCRSARAWLDREGFSYSYRDVDEASSKLKMRALNPRSTIPTIDIEGQIIVGFDGEGMRAAIRRAAEARAGR